MRIFSRQVPQRNYDNAIAVVERTFNRDADRYAEKVTMQDTGQVIHNTDERLSEHMDHGSDKTER